MSSSDISFDNIISPAINWNKYLDPNVDEDDLIEDDLLIDEFLSTMYTECSLPLVPSTFSYPSSPVLVFYDNTTNMRYSSLADMLSSSLQICDPGLSRILLSAGVIRVVEQSSSELGIRIWFL
uniref:Uncharacterized protein n=1 Tax=Rhizophagus irregularis (strain DAOM 181602 / DAOM 197198 / MUCL 43194) TaxID=747089 RepID=U9TJU7_RHIID